MASPIGAAGIAGVGEQQLKSLILQWIQEAIRDNTRGGIGLSSQEIYFSATNFPLTTGSGVKATSALAIPNGMTGAVISVIARAVAFDPNTSGGSNGAGADYLYCQPSIGATNGNALPLNVGGSNGSGINVSPLSVVLSGLTPGGTLTLSVSAWSYYLAWAANADNVAELSGIVNWLR